MSTKADEFSSIIYDLILKATRFFVPRLGQVSKIDDSEGRGRILVHIPSLGWTTDDTGAWCFPDDKKSLITPAVGDWVIVQWIDGNIDLPVYTGISTRMKDMLPANYEDENTQIIFEDKNRETCIKYDEANKLLTALVNGNITFEDQAGNQIRMENGNIIFKSGDASTWTPCIIGNCIFSGAPHGGTVAGITKLKGE